MFIFWTFHPTEFFANKIADIVSISNKILLHVSRPMRWDFNHVLYLMMNYII